MLQRLKLLPPSTAVILALALAWFLPQAGPQTAQAAEPARSLDLLVLQGPCGLQDLQKAPRDAAGRVSELPVLCWERTSRQEAMEGPMLDSALRIKRKEAPRQIPLAEIESLLGAAAAPKGAPACAASADRIRQAGGTVFFKPLGAERRRCVVSGIAPEALREIFHDNVYPPPAP